MACPMLQSGAMRARSFFLTGLVAFVPFAGFADSSAPRRVVGQALSGTQVVLLDDDSGEYRVVRLGDELNGGQVVSIGHDGIVLIHGGTKEILHLAPDPRPR